MAKPADGKAIKKGKKNRKHGRWSRVPSNQRYKAEGRRERNKVRKVKRHLKANPGDRQAARWLREHGFTA